MSNSFQQLSILDHPAAAFQLARLRDKATPPSEFRVAAARLGALLAADVASLVPSVEREVATPLGPAPASGPGRIVLVPVLRAGLGLLWGALEVFPDAAIGMIGLERNEETHEAREYYRNVPDLTGATLIVLEPMLATGGSAADALDQLQGADTTYLLSVVATQVGIDRISERHPNVAVRTCTVDPELNDQAYIVPGLGDFGDRLWGT